MKGLFEGLFRTLNFSSKNHNLQARFENLPGGGIVVHENRPI
jgi:hypothetical protein